MPIEIKAAVALILVQLVHKFVSEIPSAIAMAGSASDPKVYALYALAGLYVLAGVLGLLRIPCGFIIGIVLGAEIILQPIVFHVILGIPKDPPYYIIFPILQGLLVVYFCLLAYRHLKANTAIL